MAATNRIELEAEYDASLAPRRGAADETLVLELDVPSDDYVIAVHHASGAVTFHPPARARERRGRGTRGGGGPVTLRFEIPVHGGTPTGAARRGELVRKIVRVVVVKLAGKVGEWALNKLAARWEAGRWNDRTRGLVLVDPAILASDGGSLPPLKDPSRIGRGGSRNLLLIHGTFSSTESGFSGLAKTVGTDSRRLFNALGDVYGDRIFGFNHFTVSESPEQNARALLKALPPSGGVFDVITHSRGALVLRTLVEQRDVLGPDAGRFQLGRAILCAGPNEGTPLADGGRWDTITSWIGNLTDLFPDNPFTFVVDFLAESLKWLAQAASQALPGIASMNPKGEVIRDLQDSPAPPVRAYWAITTNHEPDETLLSRAADLGIDAFFAEANDMVVPTAGGWRVDDEAAPTIPAGQIVCFGPGGNVRVGGRANVHHCNLFSQPETIDLLVRILRDEPLGVRPLDPATEPPAFAIAGRRRAVPARPVAPTAAPAAQPAPMVPLPVVAAPSPVPVGAEGASAGATRPGAIPQAQVVTLVDAWGRASSFTAPIEPPADENFNLFLVATPDAREGAGQYYLLASYRNARVLVSFKTRGGEFENRWRRIEEARNHLTGYIDGDPKYRSLPTDQALRDLGRDLFDVLFPGDVRRLYDHARAEFSRPVGAQVAERRLSIIFTSMVGWISDKPWEFAYDPSRRALLAAHDLNFVRNVLTAVPAEARLPRQDKLRVLVVAAQPVGAIPLSVDEEVAVIARGFQPLVDAQLAEVQIVPSVTPERLHELMQSSAYGNDPIDVLHFIGHGEYDESARTGFLLFENDAGGTQKVDAEIITQIVARRGVRLVFFNACETGTGYAGALDFASGVAPSLVAAGVPAVVANQFPVLDPSATAFARHFYWSLAHGRGIGDAAREARVAVNYSITGEAIDWAVPVVFARNPYESLVVAPVSLSTAATVAAVRTAVRQTRRGARDQKTAVGVWDVNHAVPRLEALLDRLSAAQDVFRFQLADITAPIGTWRRLRRPPGADDRGRLDGPGKNDGQLHANEVFDKLRDVPARLGVSQLICLTTFGLTDETAANLDSQQTGDRRITIISTAGLLPKMSPPARSLERLLVNQLVAYVNPVPPHRGRANRCPNYEFTHREILALAGFVHLCRPCRQTLTKRREGSGMLRALDVLLQIQVV
jgi:hypothetical protein